MNSVFESVKRTFYRIKCILFSLVPVRSSDISLAPCPICGRKPYIYEDAGPWGAWYAIYCPTSWLLFKLFGASKHSHIYVYCGRANPSNAYEFVAKEWNHQAGRISRSCPAKIYIEKNRELKEQLLTSRFSAANRKRRRVSYACGQQCQ